MQSNQVVGCVFNPGFEWINGCTVVNSQAFFFSIGLDDLFFNLF